MSRAALAAFVLHHWDWSESSLIVDLFTREQGRIVVAAKGAKRPHSNLRAVLLPFQRIAVGLGRGSADAEIQTLRSAEWAGGAAMPSGAALFSGFYANELLLKLLARHDPHPALWDAYAHLVERLPVAEGAALRAFELVLLQETGVLPALDVETLTQAPLAADAGYALRPEAGLAATGGDESIAGGDWLRLHAALAAGDRPALEAACAAVLPALKPMLRHLLHYHLGTSRLATRDVLRSLRQLAP
jgi:DNA repair protein RecO (recombination protein O)